MSFLQEPLQPNTLDSLLNKIGPGKAQLILSRPLIILFFCEGCESIVLGILIPYLSKQWELASYHKSLLISFVYLGVILGSYLQTFSDKFGRYSFVLVDAIMQTLFGLLSCLCLNYSQFLICRFFYGIGLGIALPLSGTYLAEISPSNFRARMHSIAGISFALGCLFASLLGWLLMQAGHWRLMLFIICTPGAYVIYDQLYNGKESIRYLWVRKQVTKSKQVLDFICQKNGVDKISLQLIKQLIQNQEDQKTIGYERSFKDLFSEKYLIPTVFLLFNWFTVCFTYYGIMILLPTILSRYTSFSNNFQYFFIFAVCAIEIIAYTGAPYLVNNPYLGRRKTVYISQGIIAIFSIFIMALSESNYLLLLIGYIIIKVFVSMCLMILYPFTAEVYETMLRGTAMGFMSLVGRIGTIMIGIVGVGSLQWFNGNGLYIIFTFLSMLSCIFMCKMPYDTLGRALV